jgi:YD repeat-containing protein
MKKTFLRLSTLMLVCVMVLAVLVGCKNPNTTNPPVNPDNPTVTEPIQITTTIYEIAKHGNLILYMYGADLFDKGFEHGDIVEIAIGDKKWEVPLCTSYSDVDNGEVVLRAIGATDGVVLAINMGDFATTAGIAEKTATQEEPGYRWDYLMESPVQLTITMKEKGGYRDEWLIRQLVRTNERADYDHLSDEAFANFRVIETTGMGKGVLYRSSSPINPALGRNTYADKAAEKAGIVTVVNLADPSNIYEGTENTYYSTCQVTYVNLGMDFLSEATLNGLAEGLRFIINNNGPYLIHCNEGKDRAGFVSALLECLMGATLDEVIDDYMVTYYNYYGVEKGTEKYNAVVNNNLIKVLNTTFKVDDVYKADLAAEAAAFLMEDAGLTADEVAALKGKLTITLQEVYDAGKTLSALLGDHESVYVAITSNGTLLQENYLSKQYSYFFYGSEYMNLGFEYSALITNHSQYNCYDGDYSYIAMLDQSGMIDMEAYFATEGEMSFISTEVLNGESSSITEKDGCLIVTFIADLDKIVIIDDGVVSCVETYTLDAKTHEMISVKTVYTYEDGTVEEGIVTITRDVEIPEGAKPFLAYEQTENLRTITVVSNPGTENEKTDVIRAPKGLQVSFSSDWNVDKLFGAYTDAACTQPIPEVPDSNADVTIYIKWEEAPVDVNEEKYLMAYEMLEQKNYDAAYALFVELGDYKDAAKEAAYFRYMPSGHYVYYVSEGDEGTVTYTVTLNDKNLPATVVEEYSTGLKHTCSFTYNEFGYVTRRECTDTEGATTLYEATYDAKGNRLSETYTDKEGNVRKHDYTYNEKNQRVTDVSTDASDYYLTYTATFEYDAEGREIKIVTKYENETIIEEFTYDAEGRILKQTWAEEGCEPYSIYDYYYDEKGRPVEILFTEEGEDGGFRRVTFNDKDQMLTEHVYYAFGYEYTYNYEYDEHGNVIKKIYANPDATIGNDITESTYKLVYIPFEFTEQEWVDICDATQCWDTTHW